MIVLIPAYEPDDRLVALVADLRAHDLAVLVVDDGSGSAYSPTFEDARRLGATVLAHDLNRGKGAALRTGFAFAAQRFDGHDVVCADCDGQHLVPDILRVAERVAVHAVDRGVGRPGAVAAEHTGVMVLGARRFTGPVPLRSRLGNAVTGVLVRTATGLPVHDTQTGLRGYPASMLDWLLSVPGDRFEYELDLLLRASQDGVPVEEVPIETVYLEGNASSHFRPIVDSARIYAPLVRFAASSLLAFLVDTVALLVLVALTGNLLVAVLGARLLSSSVNFAVNRRLVFSRGRDKPLGAAAAQYWTLAATLLAANYGLLSAMTGLGVGLLPAKVLTELAMFVASYQLQRTVVFAQPVADRLPHDAAPQPARTAATALTSMSAPGTPSPATRAAVTSGGAPGPASRGAMAP